MNMWRTLTFSLIALFYATSAYADGASPVGLWKSYDDAGTTAKALIRITEHNGIFEGRIEKLILAPSEDQNPTCIKCKGERKGQLLVGMNILSRLKKEGDDFNGGQIFDPEVGETYKCKMVLLDSGKKLSVRGYIGIPVLGRSQVWQREE